MQEIQYALIVAGGKGTRMGLELPKQYIKVGKLPILMHTINAFYQYSNDIRIILVLPESDLNTWKELCRQFHFNIPVILQKGGKSRFQSVKNGLGCISTSGLVAIHDGVRPFIRKDLIAASFNIASLHGNAVAAVRLKESIRIIDKDGTQAIDRSRFRLIQTPQTFRVNLIKSAYETEEDQSLTDDASVLEKMGERISLFEGDYANIKITTPEDLKIAEILARDFEVRHTAD
ncbi:MAG: 2-C-methyl-D-erythritol 4-phosphate cytidylyltransferase [Candidatus Cyclobacteriaceae bacterium M3_2C_046]